MSFDFGEMWPHIAVPKNTFDPGWDEGRGEGPGSHHQRRQGHARRTTCNRWHLRSLPWGPDVHRRKSSSPGLHHPKISFVGKWQRLVKSIETYNKYKRDHRAAEEREPSINAGLPTPDDRLGKPTGELIDRLDRSNGEKSWSILIFDV